MLFTCSPASRRFVTKAAIFVRDHVHRGIRQGSKTRQILDSVFVVLQSLWFVLEPGFDERQEVLFGKILQRGNEHPVADADLSLCQRRLVCGFDLLSHALIGLLGALPDWFAIPGEPVPPDAPSLVDRHSYVLAGTAPLLFMI